MKISLISSLSHQFLYNTLYFINTYSLLGNIPNKNRSKKKKIEWINFIFLALYDFIQLHYALDNALLLHFQPCQQHTIANQQYPLLLHNLQT